MKRWIKHTLPLLITLAVMATGTLAAEAQSRRGRGRSEDRPRGAMRDLDLTREQRDELRELRRESRREALRRQGRMADLRAQIQAEMLEETLDRDRVKTLARELGDLVGEAAEARVHARLAMLSVLTGEQRMQMQERGWQKDPRRRRGRMERGRRGFGIPLDLGVGGGSIGGRFGPRTRP